MLNKVIDLLKDKNMLIPNVLFKHYKKLNITDSEFVFLIYLINENSSVIDYQKYSFDLSIDMNQLLELINSLSNKGIIEFEMKKKATIREEHLCLDGLYKKIAFLIISEEEKKEETGIYSLFEKEFGRTLSPVEYELINGWISGGYQEEIIILALKEAVYNGAFNLRYIDKIIYEWNKKGIKTADDVNRNKEQFRKKKEEIKEVFSYDWLNDKNE